MVIRFSDLEKLGVWCANSEEMADDIGLAAPIFFEGADEGLTEYAEKAGEHSSVERRFFGWFMFGYTLPNGKRPAEIAARSIFKRRRLDEALAAIEKAQYVVGSVTAVHPDRAVFIKVADQQQMEIRDRRLADPAIRNTTLFTWVLPARPKVWIPGPGWTVFPMTLGQGIRADMDLIQCSPIDLERLLRVKPANTANEDMFKVRTLAEAVDRMTKAAEVDQRPNLIKTEAEWERLVLRYLLSMAIDGFFEEIMEELGLNDDTDALNMWIALAQDIWNTTPQPDRGGKTALELMGESRQSDR